MASEILVNTGPGNGLFPDAVTFIYIWGFSWVMYQFLQKTLGNDSEYSIVQFVEIP